jgi:hypothetical protein
LSSFALSSALAFIRGMSRRGRGQSSYIELVHGPTAAFIKFLISVKLDRFKRSSLGRDSTGSQSATPAAVLLFCATVERKNYCGLGGFELNARRLSR